MYNFLERASIYVIVRRTLLMMKILNATSDGLVISVSMEDYDEELKITLLTKDNPKFFPNGISAVLLGSNIINNRQL